MNTTRSAHRLARQANPLWRPGRILLAVAGLAAALLASACDSAQQVPWATYNSQLQPQIDAATATRDCAALQVLLTGAKATSTRAREGHRIPQRRPRRLHPGQPARGGLPVGKRLTERPRPGAPARQMRDQVFFEGPAHTYSRRRIQARVAHPHTGGR